MIKKLISFLAQLLILLLILACSEKLQDDPQDSKPVVSELEYLTGTYCGYKYSGVAYGHQYWRISASVFPFVITGTENPDSFLLKANWLTNLNVYTLPVELHEDRLIFKKDSFDQHETSPDRTATCHTIFRTSGYGVQESAEDGWIFTFINETSKTCSHNGTHPTRYDTLFYRVEKSTSYSFDGKYVCLMWRQDTLQIERMESENEFRIYFGSNENNPLQNKVVEVYGSSCCLRMNTPVTIGNVEILEFDIPFTWEDIELFNGLHSIGELVFTIKYKLQDNEEIRRYSYQYGKYEELN